MGNKNPTGRVGALKSPRRADVAAITATLSESKIRRETEK